MSSTIDDLRRQLTFKGLQESDFQQSPLKKFIGTMTDLEPQVDSKYTNSDGSARVRVLFKFSDVEVLECQPGQSYAFPVAEFVLPHSNKKNSKWGILATSLELIDKDLDAVDLIGKKATYGLVVHQLFAGKEKGVIPQECWEVLELEGATAVGGSATTTSMDPKKAALGILFGKTKQEFEAQVLRDPVVKKDGSLVSEIIGNHFIPSMEESGLIHKDADGRYQAGPA